MTSYLLSYIPIPLQIKGVSSYRKEFATPVDKGSRTMSARVVSLQVCLFSIIHTFNLVNWAFCIAFSSQNQKAYSQVPVYIVIIT